jgi:ElaB/YqjD/DUF883 family membrane-anchored ribosome-binding protein
MESSDGAHGMADRAREIAGSAEHKLADVGTSVRERAGSMKDSLADALESGADKLRARNADGGTNAPNGQLAPVSATGGVAVETGGAIAHATEAVTEKVAGGMQATADWLHSADLDSLKSGVERQVKEHPGRSLLVAAGIGYLLGKSMRK